MDWSAGRQTCDGLRGDRREDGCGQIGLGRAVVDDERILIIDKFHYFIRAVLEKNLPLQEYILKFMQFAEENKDTIVIADEIGNGIVPLDAFEREYREQTGRAEILLAKKADEVVRVICGIGQKIK